MKNNKKFAALTLAAVMTVMTGCGASVPANSVFSVDDLAGKTIAVQLGTTGDTYATDEADALNKAMSTEADSKQTKTVVDRYNKGADAVQALKQGKADVVIIDEQPAKAFVEKNDDLTILEDVFADEEYAICIAKENTELTEQFNQAIHELKEEGIVEQIVNNYIGDDTKGTCPYETPEGTEYPNGTLVMATNAEFEPYEFYRGEHIVGIDAELAKAICDKLGYGLKIEDMKFDGIIAAVQSGRADFGAAGMTVTEDRLKNINFTDTYTQARQVMIVRKK